MSSIDPAKLKVVDLRSELTARGLDSKGNKAALVKRLKDALEKELKQDLPDTSIADTSTEELDTSQGDENVHESPKKDKDKPPAEEAMETDEPKLNRTPEKPKLSSAESKSVDKTNVEAKTPEKQKETITEPSETKTEPTENAKPVKPASESDASKDDVKDQKTEENGEHSEQVEEKPHKSRWSEDNKQSEEADSLQPEDKEQETEAGTSKPEGESDHKGEKRRRSSPSPDRSQRRRSRSPIKEDEPTIDNDKVQLNWYDSDLHLQLDKESFLSAKPLTEGAFGYAWAGVRGTHGVSSGKVCYEVKLVEELKWDDFSKYEPRGGGRDRYRTDHRKNQKRDKDKRESEKKPGEKSKTENEEGKEDKSEEDKDNSADKEEKQDTDEAEKLDDNVVEPEQSEKSDDKSMETDEKPVDTDEKPVETDEKSVKTDEKPMESEEKVEDGDQKPMETDASADAKTEGDDTTVSEPKDDKADTEETKKEVSDPIPSHLFRVGWSLIKTTLQLGEEKYSYAYESSGKFVTEKQFVDYGIKYGVGDVVGAYLDINSDNVTITYTVNGEVQPVATTISRTDLPEEDFALFPHVLSRNYTFEFNLGDKEEPWFPIPAELEGYSYISKIEDKIVGPLRPETRADCEVILMCGLPASGKTHWVKEHVGSNPDKRYTVLGNTNLLEKMTVSGEPLKSKFKGRWSMLVDKLQKSLNKLISIASLRRRNYIIDQTNVFPSAQRRKMRPFEGFKRRAVIVVVGDEEQARRQSLQEAQDGKDVPDSTILEMKAAMALPEKGDWIEEVTYVGLEEAEAKEIVKKYNAAGKEAGYGIDKRMGRRDDRWQNRRNDYRGGKGYRERSYQSQRYDPRGPRQGGWSNQRSGGGNWNRDRRDSRGPPNRDWRGSGRDHGNRGSHNQVGNYNRSRQTGGRGNWSGWGNQQGWTQQNYGSGSGSGGYGGSQGWGNWKYNQGGSGQGYGNYQNWNYYGQYAQNWNSQGQQTNSAAGSGSGNSSGNSQYGQGYNTQEAWAQYARQYAQQSAAAQNQAAPNTKK